MPLSLLLLLLLVLERREGLKEYEHWFYRPTPLGSILRVELPTVL